jgi:ATP-dependent Clp protease protease subunit
MNDLYVKYTGRQLEEIERALDRDTFLEADEAPARTVDKVFDRAPLRTKPAKSKRRCA